MARSSTRAPGEGRRLKRSRSLALRLDGRRLVVEDFLAHRRYEINDDALALLRAFDRWQTPAEVAGQFAGYASASVAESARLLLRKNLLVAEGGNAARRQQSIESWGSWDGAGTYFHFATRSTRFARTEHQVRANVARITRTPMPSIYKEDPPGPRIHFRAPSAELAPGPIGQALMRRRTCREFLERPIGRRQLEAVTALCFGRLGLIDGGPYGTLLHRASPSGGARHPIECYVMALGVSGVTAGLYHYSVRENALVKLREEAARNLVLRFTCGQEWFSDAAAVFILTAVFARSQWKYRTPRALRVVLIDAAHACQNLLLTATSLGLGAFSVAAIDEAAIDRYLGIDGVTEGSLYVAGIGWPDKRRIGRLRGPGRLLPGGPPERRRSA